GARAFLSRALRQAEWRYTQRLRRACCANMCPGLLIHLAALKLSCPAATGAAHASGFSCGPPDHSTERPNQFRTGCAELCETLPGEVAQNLFSSRGEANEHLPSVFLSPDAPDQPALLQSVAQSQH